MAGTKISEATLRSHENLKGTEQVPIVDTDLPKGRTTLGDLKTFMKQDLSQYATKEYVNGIKGVIPSGTTSDRPSNPDVGTLYFDTDLGNVVTWNGTEWVEPSAGQGTVLLHADTGSATEDGGTTAYRFTETQEEIDKIIDTFKDAEAATVSVIMGSDPFNAPMYSLACVRVEDGIVGYVGIAVVTAKDGSVDMVQLVLTKEPQVSILAVAEDIIPSIQDYLVPFDFYTRTMREGAYINTDGEYVENENFNVIDIYPSGGGMNAPQYGTVVITNNDTDEATGISVFSDSSLKPVDYESGSTTQVCFNCPYAQYASIHKDAKVFAYKSSVFAFMMGQVHKLQKMWNFFGIDINSSIDFQIVTRYSEGAIADKYNNIHGEQVDKEAGIGYEYFIFPLTLKAGDILTFDSRPGTTTDMAALKDADGNIIPAVPLNAAGSPQTLAYMTSKDINVELSGCGTLICQKSNSFVLEFLMKLSSQSGSIATDKSPGLVKGSTNTDIMIGKETGVLYTRDIADMTWNVNPSSLPINPLENSEVTKQYVASENKKYIMAKLAFSDSVDSWKNTWIEYFGVPAIDLSPCFDWDNPVKENEGKQMGVLNKYPFKAGTEPDFYASSDVFYFMLEVAFRKLERKPVAIKLNDDTFMWVTNVTFRSETSNPESKTVCIRGIGNAGTFYDDTDYKITTYEIIVARWNAGASAVYERTYNLLYNGVGEKALFDDGIYREAVTFDKISEMLGVNADVSAVTPEVAQEGKYYNLSGEVADNAGYNISAPVSLNDGDTLLVKSVSFANVAMIKDADGNIVPARSTTQNKPVFYSYTATKATTVEISYRNTDASKFYKYSSGVLEQLAKLISENKRKLDSIYGKASTLPDGIMTDIGSSVQYGEKNVVISREYTSVEDGKYKKNRANLYIGTATPEKSGFMSAADKEKLDSMSAVSVVAELPETPDENKVYIIKGS